MKKNVRTFLIFVISVVLILSLSFTASAWGYDDIDTDDIEIGSSSGVLTVSEYYLDQQFAKKEYLAGQWPNSFTFYAYEPIERFDIVKMNFSSPIPAGHGLFAIGIFPLEMINSDITNLMLTVGGETWTAVNYNIATGEINPFYIINVFEDDFQIADISSMFGSGVLALAISGTVNRQINYLSLGVDCVSGFTGEISIDYHIGDVYYTPFLGFYSNQVVVDPFVDTVSIGIPLDPPFYPGTEVQLNAEVSGPGIFPGSPESSVYWYVHGNTSPDTTIDNEGKLTIANDETVAALEVEAISTYDSTKSSSVSVPVTYPLNLQITPAQSTLIASAKRQEIQFELLLPNGQPFDYSLLEWTTTGADGQYFRIDDNGLLEILPGAPAGSVTVKYAYQHDAGNVSTTSATVTITTQQEGIYDQLTPTPEQSDKADQMEDAIGDAADKLENNNSSLVQLTPTRPQINTDLQLDPDKLIAVSPLVTNIWSISGLQSLIGIVVLVATVAYIFFGKRDG